MKIRIVLNWNGIGAFKYGQYWFFADMGVAVSLITIETEASGPAFTLFNWGQDAGGSGALATLGSWSSCQIR